MSVFDWMYSDKLFDTVSLVELEANEVLIFFQIVVSTFRLAFLSPRRRIANRILGKMLVLTLSIVLLRLPRTGLGIWREGETIGSEQSDIRHGRRHIPQGQESSCEK
jgi:hypothetical protein